MEAEVEALRAELRAAPSSDWRPDADPLTQAGGSTWRACRGLRQRRKRFARSFGWDRPHGLGIYRRPCLVANRATLPQTWPPPPRNVADSCELTATTKQTKPSILLQARARGGHEESGGRGGGASHGDSGGTAQGKRSVCCQGNSIHSTPYILQHTPYTLLPQP